MRIIDADDLLRDLLHIYQNICIGIACKDCPMLTESLNCKVEEMINEAPTIDAEPVVRCKDCLYNKGEVNLRGFQICSANGMGITDDDYCSWGERMDKGEEEK